MEAGQDGDSRAGHPGAPQEVCDPPAKTGTGKPKLLYVDCLRGYAILMVIATHVTYAVPQLPYPVHRLTSFGWFGVQLFFLASCLTLMMSSDFERSRAGSMNVGNFFIRRFLRIAPMYYLAGVFYWFASSHAGANLAQAISAVTFTNAWGPAIMPTTGGWQLVPGGWSIGVEFTFYFVFPLFFAVATTWRRALLIFLGSLVLGAAMDSAVVGPLTGKYGFTPTDNFLFFWFFNQASVFALGGLVFFAVKALGKNVVLAARLRSGSTAIAVACLALLALLALGSDNFTHYLALRPVLPGFVPVVVLFAVFILALSQAKSALFVNRAIGSMGQVSFSAYLLHFAVLDWVIQKHPDTFHLNARGFAAIGVFVIAYATVVILTYLVSAMTYRMIELPMIGLAKQITRRSAVPAAVASSQAP